MWHFDALNDNISASPGKRFLDSQINFNLPNAIKSLSPDEVRLWVTFERCFCVQNMKSECVLLMQNVCW